MNWNVLATIGIATGIYILCVLLCGFYKRYRNKKKIQKEDDSNSKVLEDEKESNK